MSRRRRRGRGAGTTSSWRTAWFGSGATALPDLEPRYRVMVVGRVKLNAVVEVVSPEQHVPGNAKAETGRTAEFNTAYPLPGDALERLGGMAVSEVQAQSWASLDDAWWRRRSTRWPGSLPAGWRSSRPS